jgi:hypothetical protein
MVLLLLANTGFESQYSTFASTPNKWAGKQRHAKSFNITSVAPAVHALNRRYADGLVAAYTLIFTTVFQLLSSYFFRECWETAILVIKGK